MTHFKAMLPRLILVGMVLVLVLGAIPAQAAKPKLVPAISPGPLSHRAELRATIHARAKLTRIELRIDNKKVQPWVKAHAGWKYTVRLPLSKVAVGMHAVKLKVRNGKNFNTQRQWQFQKLAELALTADKTSIAPGEKVTLTGQGFTPGTAITVGMGGQNTGAGGNYGSAVAAGSGSFVVEVTLDKFPDGSPLHAGTITLVAHGPSWSQRAAIQIRIVERLPAAPSDLHITSLTKANTSAEPSLVGLQWRDNSSNETGFRIQASFTRMNGGADTRAWSAPVNTTAGQVSFAAGGINPIARACFTVTAFNVQGDSTPSNEVCAVL